MTPKWVYDAVEAAWGRPVLDPCWHPQSPVKPVHAYCLESAWNDQVIVHAGDGLQGAWNLSGWIWLNVPYSNVTPWLRKAWEFDQPFAALLKFDPTTRWYEEFVRSRDCDVGVFPERLKYGRTDGGKQMSASFVSCLVTRDLFRPRSLNLDYLERP